MGVSVIVGVLVMVGVFVLVGVSVGVLVGRGVVVPVGVLVIVGVLVAVLVAVGVLVGVAVASAFGAFFGALAEGSTGALNSGARLTLAVSPSGPALADCSIRAIPPQPSTSSIKTADTDSHPLRLLLSSFTSSSLSLLRMTGTTRKFLPL